MAQWKPPSLSQPTDDYRYSADAWLLAAFAAHFQPNTYVDLGTGSGVVAYALQRLRPEAQGIAIERRAELFRYARMNLDGLPVLPVLGDLRQFPWSECYLDMLICNPPYFGVGEAKTNRHEGIALARHAYHGDIVDFAEHLSSALKPSGSLCYIFPYQLHERGMRRLNQMGWSLTDRLSIHSFADREPRLVCLRFKRAGRCEVNEHRLTLYQDHRDYTDEAIGLLDAAKLPYVTL